MSLIGLQERGFRFARERQQQAQGGAATPKTVTTLFGTMTTPSTTHRTGASLTRPRHDRRSIMALVDEALRLVEEDNDGDFL